MALRIANKFHNLVNNVVLRAAAQQHQMACTATTATPSAMRTRPQPSQLDAYVEQLHHSATMKPVHHVDAPMGHQMGVSVHVCGCPRCAPPLATALRCYSKARSDSKERKTARCTGEAAPAKKPRVCIKMEKSKDKCQHFKVERCKPSKVFDCSQRVYKFKECRKNPAPYPSFSEACAEEPPFVICECKDCPWAPDRHPTFKQPRVMLPAEMKRWKAAQSSKRRLHTDAARHVTLRFGDLEQEALQREKYERDVQNQPYAMRPHVQQRRQQVIAQVLDEESMVTDEEDGDWKPVTKFAYKPLPLEHSTEPMVFLSELVDRKRIVDEEMTRQHMYEEAMAKVKDLMIEAKQRVRVTGEPVCPKRDCDTVLERKKCPKKIKSKVCPTDLLDRKPYKKRRDAMKAKKNQKKKKGSGKKGRSSKKEKRMAPEEFNAMVMETEAGRGREGILDA